MSGVVEKSEEKCLNEVNKQVRILRSKQSHLTRRSSKRQSLSKQNHSSSNQWELLIQLSAPPPPYLPLLFPSPFLFLFLLIPLVCFSPLLYACFIPLIFISAYFANLNRVTCTQAASALCSCGTPLPLAFQ